MLRGRGKGEGGGRRERGFMDILENARPENCFYCVDGSVLRSILELEQKLRAMSNQAFYHHVNQSRNDFSNWVKDVFHEHNLANGLLKAKTPAEAAAAVRRHIRKTFLAEEKIESAIRKVVEERKPAKAKTNAVVTAAKKLPRQKAQAKKAAQIAEKAAAATKTKQRQQENKNGKKNTKLNKKKQRVKQRKIRQRLKNSRNRGSGGSGKRGASAFGKNQIKKHMRQWLKWLKLSPEL